MNRIRSGAVIRSVRAAIAKGDTPGAPVVAEQQQPWRVRSALPGWPLTQVSRAAQRHGEAGPDGLAPGGGAASRAAELISAGCR